MLRWATFQFSLFSLYVTLSIAKGLAVCVVTLCSHGLASREIFHFVQDDIPTGIKNNNTRATARATSREFREFKEFSEIAK